MFLDDLSDHVSIPEKPMMLRCRTRGCSQVLDPDTGVSDEGIPSCWYKCRRCNGNTCALGRHVIKPWEAVWTPGRTAQNGSMVVFCAEGTCASLFSDFEKMVVAFQNPRGHDAQRMVMRLRAKQLQNKKESWLAISADTMMEVYNYYAVVLPREEERALAAKFDNREKLERMSAEDEQRALDRMWAVAGADMAAYSSGLVERPHGSYSPRKREPRLPL